MADFYTERGLYKKSLKIYYNYKALYLDEVYSDKISIQYANLYNSIGKIYLLKKEYLKAEKYLTKSINVYRKLKFYFPAISNDLALAKIKLNEQKEAENLLNEALKAWQKDPLAIKKGLDIKTLYNFTILFDSKNDEINAKNYALKTVKRINEVLEFNDSLNSKDKLSEFNDLKLILIKKYKIN